MAQDFQGTPKRLRSVPALPRVLAEPTPVVLTGTALWFLAFVGFGVHGWLTGDLGTPLWTSGAGAALGLIGYGVFHWQRWAARRGARGAWRGFG